MTIEPYALANAIEAARTLLLRGKFEGNPVVDGKLNRTRAYLETELNVLHEAIFADPDATVQS
jgi:hypothetical protein